MKAMILAAGFGTRLRPLTNQVPKPLLPVGGRSLLEWNLLLLRRFDIRDIIINLHYLGSQIEETFGDGSRLGLRLTYSPESQILGTGGGIKQAEPFFGNAPFLVLNGDTLCELDIHALLQFHTEQQTLATMVVREDPDAETWGPVEVTSSGRVQRINGIGRSQVDPSSTYMFAGIHIIHPRLLRDIPQGQETSIIDAYQRVLAQEQPIAGFCMTGYWSDVGTVERYEQAQRDLESKRIMVEARLQDTGSSEGRGKR